jgi:hypothetical protein
MSDSIKRMYEQLETTVRNRSNEWGFSVSLDSFEYTDYLEEFTCRLYLLGFKDGEGRSDKVIISLGNGEKSQAQVLREIQFSIREFYLDFYHP